LITRKKITQYHIGPTLLLFERVGTDLFVEFGFQSGLASNRWPKASVVIDYPLMEKRERTFHLMIKNAPFMTHNPDGTVRLISVIERVNSLWENVGTFLHESPIFLMAGQTTPLDYPVNMLKNVKVVAGIFDEHWTPPFKIAREEWLSWCRNNAVPWISFSIRTMGVEIIEMLRGLLQGKIKTEYYEIAKSYNADIYIPEKMTSFTTSNKEEKIVEIVDRLIQNANLYALKDDQEVEASREEIFSVLHAKLRK
ncbi:MAG: hypothetical protein QXL15_04855, partial [Candidatus Korarchaeota archaeon]